MAGQEASAAEMSEEELEAFFGKVAPEYRYRRDRFLRPSIDGAGDAPSPLMTWWLLLYSFSILARYEPRQWAEAARPRQLEGRRARPVRAGGGAHRCAAARARGARRGALLVAEACGVLLSRRLLGRLSGQVRAP